MQQATIGREGAVMTTDPFDSMALSILLKMIDGTTEPSRLPEMALWASKAAATIYFYLHTQYEASSDKPQQESR